MEIAANCGSLNDSMIDNLIPAVSRKRKAFLRKKTIFCCLSKVCSQDNGSILAQIVKDF
jgi:hypothetical protein